MAPGDAGSGSGASFGYVPVGAASRRAFLRRRLRLYALLLTAMSGVFYLVNEVAVAAVAPELLRAHTFAFENLLHLAQIALSAGVLAGLSVTRPSDRALAFVDALLPIGSTTLFGAMVLGGHDTMSHLVAALCFLAIIPARAVFVPSSARRTLVLGIAAAVPFLTFSAFSRAPLQTVYVATWAVVAITTSTVASRIIFGLSERVREARQLGQYTLLDPIGAGGMGEVYRAHHAMLRRPTAVKLVRPERVGEETVRRFEREVRLTARLTHPNTVAVYDYGRTPDGVFYYAMELLDGVDLQRLVDEHGPMPAERVVNVLAQICGSLGEAHALGVIHRDVKPANVVLCRRGRLHDVVKVLDFGLVKDLRETEDVAVSAENAIAGTPLYLAPEAIQRPDAVDARADLYAVGLVGWFLLTGRPVFEGQSVVEVCAHHLHTPPRRPSELGVAVDADLEDALLRCLAKDPADRFEDVDALATALAATGAAGRWSEARARAWWAEHETGPAPSASPAAAAQTGVLSVDLARRS